METIPSLRVRPPSPPTVKWTCKTSISLWYSTSRISSSLLIMQPLPLCRQHSVLIEQYMLQMLLYHSDVVFWCKLALCGLRVKDLWWCGDQVEDIIDTGITLAKLVSIWGPKERRPCRCACFSTKCRAEWCLSSSPVWEKATWDSRCASCSLINSHWTSSQLLQSPKSVQFVSFDCCCINIQAHSFLQCPDSL